MKKENKEIAIVFGLFETGLGVIRSLGRNGIKVYGVDYNKDIAYYSRYVKPLICPHPLKDSELFVDWLIKKFGDSTEKIPIFISADDFLMAISKHRDKLKRFLSFNLVPHLLLEQIGNKYQQYLLAKNANIIVPQTWVIKTFDDLSALKSNDRWPLLLKGMDVNSWRAVFGGTTKGFVCNNLSEIQEKTSEAIKNDVPIIIQQIISGPDTNHFKYCAYINSSGEILAELCLRKIRQLPVRFGVGAVVETINYPELIEVGRHFFTNIDFTGVGSAEFKIDEKDGKLKLIELNPRYWQQNSIGEKSGVNFPMVNYFDLKKYQMPQKENPKEKVLWINRYMDFSSFLQYRKEGLLTFSEWRKSLKGKKVYSDFAWDDPIPLFYEFGFGMKLFKLPFFIYKKLFSVEK